VLVWVALAAWAQGATAGEVVFALGTPDRSYAEFALAREGPGAFNQAFPREIVVRAQEPDAFRRFPFIQPSTSDAWAGSRTHPIRLLFELPEVPRGTYRLTVHFAATHWAAPPLLVVALGGVSRVWPLPASAVDDTVLRDAQACRPVVRSFDFPAAALRPSGNELVLRTVDGSWVLYDAILLERTDSPATPAPEPVFRLGVHDDSYREFALAHEGYGAFRQRFAPTAVFRVGTDAAADAFPYLHPGPTDAWAGSAPHPIAIEFGLDAAAAGDGCLVLDLVAAHGTHPPLLECDLNGSRVRRQAAAGPGDVVLVDPTRGFEQLLAFRLPADSFRVGVNRLTLTATHGSWALYDALELTFLNGDRRPPGLRLSGLTGSGLVRRDPGHAGRVAWVHCDYWGPAAAAEVTVTCDQETVTQGLEALPLGVSRQALTLPPAAGTGPTTVRVAAAGLTAEISAHLGRPAPRTVYVVPSIHTDIGYTHIQAECARRHVSSLVSILRACDDTRDYPPGSALKWTCEVTWEVEQLLALAPEVAPRLFELCRQGRVDISAAYANLLTGLMGTEQSCRLTYLARRLAREQGLTLECATMTDVPTHAWWLPSVLAGSGVRYLAVGCNDGRGAFAAGNPLVPPLWWEGPDGRRVLFFFAGGYAQASGLGLFESLEAAEARLPDWLGPWSAPGYPYEMVMAYGGVGDNQIVSHDEALRLANVVRAWNERYENPRLVLATATDFFRDFAIRYGDGLPVARGDAGAYWEDGAASSAHETALNRETHEWLCTAEKLHTWLTLTTPRHTYPAERLAQVLRDALLYDEHTWGAHNSITEPESDFVREQWAVKAGFATAAHATATGLVTEGLQAMARHAGPLPQGGLLVVNPLSWARPGIVFVDAGEAPFAVTDPATGRPVPQQLVEDHGRRRLAFLAADVPGLGSRRFGRAPLGAWPELPGLVRTTGPVDIDAGHYRLRLAPERGGVVRLVDSASGRDLVDTTSPFALGQWIYDLGVPAPARETLARRTAAVGTEVTHSAESPVVGQARMTVDLAPLGPAELIVTWSPLVPGLGVEVATRKRETTDPESVFVAFPLAVPGGTIRYETGFALAHVEADQLPNGCRDWYAVHHVVDVAGDQFGVTWATRDAFLVEFGDIQTGRWLRQLPLTNQTLFANVMNNLWFTNYKASQGGDLRFRFALLPRAGGFDRAAAIRFGYELSNPLLVSELPAGPASAAAPDVTPGFVRVEPTEVMVLTAKQAEHGEGLVVRLQELSGIARECTLTLPRPIRQAELCNLVEEPRERLLCSGPVCQVPLPAGALATVRIVLE
jgi:hypothetical protein